MRTATNRWLRRARVLAGATLAGAVAAACVHDPVSVSVAGARSRSLDAAVGADVTITLQTVGPGEYASPPEVSSRALAFVGVAPAAISVPAGPTQLFRFRAAGRGTAIVTFRHTGAGRTVEDTVRVR